MKMKPLFLRKECMEFWISLFADLRDSGLFDGGFLDKSLLQFCCMGLIQVSLYEIMFFVCEEGGGGGGGGGSHQIGHFVITLETLSKRGYN